jgi:hypothetical protein
MMNRSIVPSLVLAALASLASGCSSEIKAEGLLPQVDVPAQPQPEPPKALPESTDAKLGSNAVTFKSFDRNEQVAYFNFSKIDAAKMDFFVESQASACPGNPPTTTVALVDFASGSEKVVQALGEDATIEKPSSDKAYIRVSVTGLAGCFGYGMTFKLDKI